MAEAAGADGDAAALAALSELSAAVSTVEEQLAPLLGANVAALKERLSALEAMDVDLTLAYAANSLFWSERARTRARVWQCRPGLTGMWQCTCARRAWTRAATL